MRRVTDTFNRNVPAREGLQPVGPEINRICAYCLSVMLKCNHFLAGKFPLEISVNVRRATLNEKPKFKNVKT